MVFDFKVTAWERVTVPEEKEQEVLQAIKDGKVNTANDIFVMFDENNCDCDLMSNTSEQMSIEENGGCATIEVLDDNGDHKWDNGDKDI